MNFISELPDTKMTCRIGGGDDPTPLKIWTDGDPQKEVFCLNKDGSIIADWVALRAMKDAFDAGGRDSHVILGAALWTARNSP